MATPYSQIVGAQAFQNVVSGERYKNVTDESIKYLLGYYGEPAYPLDQELMELVMSLPKTKELLDWQPEGYLTSVEQMRQELGSDLTDDDLLLKVLIPGRLAKGKGAASSGAAATSVSGAATTGAEAAPPSLVVGSRAFLVDVDGEVFNVKISSVPGGDGGAVTIEEARAAAGPRELPEGAILAGAPGLLLSIRVGVGETVAVGDEIAMMEIMKMRRSICSLVQGVVKEIRAQEGQMLDADDVLLVVG
jgi:biotin carboxyl carrier protein